MPPPPRPHLTPTPPWLPSDTGHQLLLPEGLPASALGTPLESTDAVPVFFFRERNQGSEAWSSLSEVTELSVHLCGEPASEALLLYCWGGHAG